jgi:hypothetical protein
MSEIINILNFFRMKISRYLFVRKGNHFVVSVKKQIDYMSSHDRAEDNYDRSFLQYHAQNISENFFLILFKNSFSVVVLLYGYIVYKLSPSIEIENNKSQSNLVMFNVNKQMLPDEIKNTYNLIEIKLDTIKYRLNYKLFRKYKKYFFHPYFVLKNLILLSMFSKVIKDTNPKVILVSMESSFSSSIIREYVNSLNIELINIMHGNSVYNIRDSFCSFDSFVIWERGFIDLFQSLRFQVDKYIIHYPYKYSFENKKHKYHLTYYLQGENRRTLIKLKAVLDHLIEHGYEIAMRVHPLYSDFNSVKKVFVGYTIQNPNVISYYESLKLTAYVCGLYSSALYHAYRNGKNVVVDDISKISDFNYLCETNYILFQKQVILLSDLLRKNI